MASVAAKVLLILLGVVSTTWGASTGGISQGPPSVGSSSSSTCTPETLQCSMPSLGAEIHLGDGYNIRNGQPIIGKSPWKSATIKNIKSQNSDNTNEYKEVLLEQEMESSERASKLGVEVDLEVNVLAGLEEVHAGGKYLTEQKKSSTSLRFLINYDSKRHYNYIPLSETPVENKNFCNTNKEDLDGPTHVITSIQYGTKAFILFEREIQRTEDSDKVALWMGTSIMYGGYQIKGNVETDIESSETYEKSSMSMHFLGNTLNVKSPTTIEQVNTTLNDLDTSSTDNPQPVSFTVTRLDEICTSSDVVFSSIGNPILTELATTLRTLSEDELRITTLLKNEIAMKPVLRQALDKEISSTSFGAKLHSFQTNLKENLKKTLVDVRSNLTDETVLKKEVNKVKNSNFGNSKSAKFLEYFEEQVSSFDIYYDVENVQVDDHEKSIQRDCQNKGNKDTYIFTLNVLPKTNLATEFFQGTLDLTENWIPNQMGSKFKQFSDKALNSDNQTTCFVVDLAESNPDHPVTFSAINMVTGDRTDDYENLPEIEELHVKIDMDTCIWRTGTTPGEVASCINNMVAIGACSGGGGSDCGNDNYVHRLRCCKTANNLAMTVNMNDCRIAKSGWGEVADCQTTGKKAMIVQQSCSSGWQDDCNTGGNNCGGFNWLHYTRTTSNVLKCCGASLDNGMALGTKGDQDCSPWQFAPSHGKDLICKHDMVVVARCGSGNQHDCHDGKGGWASHGIKCCKLFALDEAGNHVWNH